MKKHDQGSDPNVVGTIGEAEQEDGGQMVDHLFLEILASQRANIRYKPSNNN